LRLDAVGYVVNQLFATANASESDAHCCVPDGHADRVGMIFVIQKYDLVTMPSHLSPEH
jgi:hypothetical protein